MSVMETLKLATAGWTVESENEGYIGLPRKHFDNIHVENDTTVRPNIVHMMMWISIHDGISIQMCNKAMCTMYISDHINFRKL